MLASSLSLRNYARCSFTFSVTSSYQAWLQNACSVVDCYNCGSVLSLRTYSRMGYTMFALHFASCGSSLSVRSYVRDGDKLSVLQFITLGSALSLRGSVGKTPYSA